MKRLKTSWQAGSRQQGEAAERSKARDTAGEAAMPYLELRVGKRRVRCADPQHVDQAAGGERLDAFILVGEEVGGHEFLGHLGQRVLVGGLLVEVGKLHGKRVETAVELARGDGLPGAPRQRLSELEVDEVFLVLVLVVDGSAPGRSHNVGRRPGSQRSRRG